MLRSRARRTGSHAENVARRQDLIEEGNNNHQHLDNFLRDQILSQKSGRSKGQRSTASCSAKQNNALIEMAAAKNNYQRRPSQINSARYNKTDTRADTDAAGNPDETDGLLVAAKVMRLSGYQADPLAATMHTRSLGLSKINVTKGQIKQDKELFNRSMRIKGDRDKGLMIDMTDQRSVASSKVTKPDVVKDVGDVEAALYRKKISENYHTSLPTFLRSQGPFAVYDHAAHKGLHSYETVGNVNEQALQRFNNEIQGV